MTSYAFIHRPRAMRLTLLILLVLGGILDARAQDADSLLAAVASRYQSLDVYHIEGTLTVDVAAGDRKQEMVMSITMAERRPTHFRLDILGNPTPMQVVSNGDTSWVYSPAEDVYIQRYAALPPGTERADIPDLLNGYKSFDDAIGPALAADTTCRIGADASTCARVTFARLVPGPSGGTDTSRVMLWVDTSRHLVIKDRMTRAFSDSPLGGPATIVQTTAFTVLDIDAPIPDSLFTFRPDPASEEVENIPRFASLSSTLRGRPAPPFSLTDLDGATVHLDSLRGKTVLLNFWATWCGPCRSEMTALQAIHDDTNRDDLIIIGVNEDEPTEQVRAFLDAQGLSFPVVLDPVSAVGRLYDVNSIPNTLIIDADGIIREHYVGARPESVFRDALEQLGF